MRDPRYIIIPILAYFFFDGLKLADLCGSGPIRCLRRLHKSVLLVMVPHIVADSARVESLALLAFDPAFAFVVDASLDLFSG